ncbi:MAG: 2Fe-2S iron-sulfur cluster-binding protein [Gammaproteobacteria bacterium]|nr:2Fe-2S iron-sulfur cluster-binding protein [Gammaproteobacteria bacterium]
MERLLSVSRAAKLVGISRGTIQKMLQDGELISFEGKLKLSDLSHHFPHIEIEDNSQLEKIDEIIEGALHRARGIKLQKLLSPDLGTLAARVHALSKELASNRAQAAYEADLLQQVAEKLKDLAATAGMATEVTQLSDWLQQNLGMPISASTTDTQLLIRDTMLRLVAAQVHLMPSGHEYLIEGNTSILEAALSAGYGMNYGCSNGECGKCRARLISGEVQLTRNHEYILSETETKQGYILACSNTAVTDIVLQAQEALDDEDIPYQEITTIVKNIKAISENLAIVTLATAKTHRLRFLSGQSALVSANNIPQTSLPIASCPCDDRNIQFHIYRSQKTDISSYLLDELQKGEEVKISGPEGNFLLDSDSLRPILFVAFNTGFAPIKGLVEHALILGNTEKAHLYWLASIPEQHYMKNLCRAWDDAFDDFRFTSLSFNESTSKNINQQLERIQQDYPELEIFEIYIAGSQKEVDIAEAFFSAHGLPETQYRSYPIEGS